MNTEKMEELVKFLEIHLDLARKTVVAEDAKIGVVGSLGHPVYDPTRRAMAWGQMALCEAALEKIRGEA